MEDPGAPLKLPPNTLHRCTACGCLWRQWFAPGEKAHGTWSLFAADQRPCARCNNPVDFVVVLDPPADLLPLIQVPLIKRRIVIVCDGEKWHTRRLRSISHDLESDEKVYRCDAPIGNDFPTLLDAIRSLGVT